MSADDYQYRDRRPLRDGLAALGLALLVHVGVLGLFWVGSLTWEVSRPPPAPSFTLVDAAPFVEAERRELDAVQQAEQAQRRLEQQREAERIRQQELEQQRQAEQQREDAEQQRQARLEEQRQRQLQREQQDEADRARQRERDELQRQQREAEQARLDELQELRRQREEAQRQSEEEQRRLDELAEQREAERARQAAEEEAERLRLASEQAEAAAREAMLQQEYISTIRELVTRNWRRPATARSGISCTVRVVQIPGGEIIDQAIANPCNADAPTRESILAAVQRTGQLPYRGYEDVFEREIVFVFRYDG